MYRDDGGADHEGQNPRKIAAMIGVPVVVAYVAEKRGIWESSRVTK